MVLPCAGAAFYLLNGLVTDLPWTADIMLKPRLGINDEGATYFPMLAEQHGKVIPLRPRTEGDPE